MRERRRPNIRPPAVTVPPTARPGVNAYAGPEALLVETRAALCAAMDALVFHKDALTLVGAHAVHERTRDVALRARETKDGDLALIPGMVSDSPLIESAMRGAGFKTLAELETEVRRHNPDVRRRFEAQLGLWGQG